MGSNREYRFHEGCLDHKWQTSYRRLWMVMKKNTIYIFRDRPFIKENHEGTLTIDGSTEFQVQREKPNNYKFLLTTGNRRVNLFKSDKKSERDLWRGYIIGVAKQKVPDDLDLPRDIINKIKQDVANYHLEVGTGISDNTSNPSTGRSPRASIVSGDRHNRASFTSADSGIISQKSPSGGSGSLTIEGIGGGPFMRHKFSNNPDDVSVPSWFFDACTREKAESYLAIAAERNLGDTLMRESTKFKQDGSYVISKRNFKNGKSSVEHYEVIRVDRGYKIKVENQHDAMRNLTDVMDYFRRTSGAMSTVPLKSNHPSDFGMAEDPYNTGRIQPIDTVADVLSEPPPDYEEPVQVRPIPRHQTMTPSSAKFNFHATRQSYNTERLGKDIRTGKPSLEDITTNIKTAAALHAFDQTIAPFEEKAKEEEYINLKDLQRGEDLASIPPPPPHIPNVPPPAPHTVLYARNNQELSYVNEQPVEPDVVSQKFPPAPYTVLYARNNHELSYVNEQPIESAPPPPRHERSKSVPNFADQLRNVSLSPLPNKAKPSSNIPPLPSRPIPDTPSDEESKDPRQGVPTPSQLGLRRTDFTKADPSQGEIMAPTGKAPFKKSQSENAIKTDFVPTPQMMGLKPTPKSPAAEPKVEQTDSTDSVPAIDQSHPGGVSSIASKFERKVSEEKPLSPKQTAGFGFATKNIPLPAACSNTSNQHYQNVTNQSKENPYDDGITPKSPAPPVRMRSKSTPTISPEIVSKLQVSRISTGNSFIRKLNEVVGGQQVQMTKTPVRTSRKFEDDEDLYEKLPDLPDV